MEKEANEIKELLPAINRELFKKPNIIATGIGFKKVKGTKTGQLCIIASVETKVAASALKHSELIPSNIEGIPTDVSPVGPIHILQSPTGRFRPAPGGVSIGHYNITAGTLGCLVKRGDKIHILSNNHVLANSNQAVTGDRILQPGPHDGGNVSDDTIAKLSGFIPIRFENESSNCRISKSLTGLYNFFARLSGSNVRLHSTGIRQNGNLVDCAIAEPVNENDVINEILQTGNISGIAEGLLGMDIKKSGRTTGFTQGIIEQTDVTVRVNFGAGKTALFIDQLMAGGMSQGGDSGSVVLNKDNEVVGLLFAGSTNSTIINRIQNVFSELDLNLV
ncbi:MAG: hypothetical protein ACLFQA_05225 [Bacteroidales bacterium]